MEEDADGHGMKALLDELEQKPAVVVISKPTGGKIHRGHRGRMEVRIDITGESCHASTPQKGKNALYVAAKVLLALKELSGNLKKDDFLGDATLAATLLEVSPAKFNTVPGSVAICVDRRLTAGETKDSALEEIRAVLPFPEIKVSCRHYDNKAWTGNSISLEKYFPSWVVPESDPAIDVAKKAGKMAYGKDLQVDRWTVSTDGVGSMGHHQISTVGFGPGARMVTDDHQVVTELAEAMEYYAAFCSAAEDLKPR